ncbi:MAG TPA: YciI family protein [Gemmatimonadales bacterium]|nr:YciI family protein [Gemmatimonadales bacterium]
MRYLCLIYEDERWWEKASESDLQQGMADYNGFTESIKKAGNYIGGEALQPTKTATSVRVRNGKISTTDGPYVETKEQLGGYYLIKAKDLNEAVQVASRIPGAKNGTVEVRPVMEFDQP